MRIMPSCPHFSFLVFSTCLYTGCSHLCPYDEKFLHKENIQNSKLNFLNATHPFTLDTFFVLVLDLDGMVPNKKHCGHDLKISSIHYVSWIIQDSYFHTVMSYGIIFWGNSAHSNNIFKLQKRIIRIITNSWHSDSCRHLFMKLDILPFYSKYLFSLLIFVIDNFSLFKTNSELYEINTRNINNFHLSQSRLTILSTLLLLLLLFIIIWVLRHLITYILV
jgi:hypothetical protein